MADDFNPLASQVDSLRSALSDLRTLEIDLKQQLAWYDNFDPTETGGLIEDYENRSRELTTRVGQITQSIADQTIRIDRLKPAIRLGPNPLYWFSTERARAKDEYSRSTNRLEVLRSRKGRLQEQREDVVRHLDEDRESLASYSSFERDEIAMKLAEVTKQGAAKHAELEALELRASSLDKELEAPREAYTAIQSEIRSLKSDYEHSQRLEHELGSASNSYERAMVHQKCRGRFGVDKPSKAADRIKRDISAKERRVAKLEHRLRDISRRGTLDVRRLIVDGSNLCYEGDKLVGLYPLRALFQELSGSIDVTVVFDASTLSKLGGLTAERLRSQLPNIKVHIAAPGTGADETILDLAQGPNAYVLSNDGFAEFPEKPAMQEDRIIRSNIIDGRLMISDLGINVFYNDYQTTQPIEQKTSTTVSTAEDPQA